MVNNHNNELECDILGCLLLDCAYSLPKAMEIITERDFYGETTRDIYKTILELNDAGVSVDTITVLNKNKKLLASYVSCLGDSKATARYIKDYCLQLREYTRRRDVLTIITELTQKINDGADAGESIELFAEKLHAIKKHGTKETIHVKDNILAVYERIKTGKENGILTGFTCIDNYMKGFHKQNLIIVASGTGKDKTALVLNFLANTISQEKNSLMFSVEMASDEIVARLISIVSEISNSHTDEYIKGRDAWDKEYKTNLIKNRIEGIDKLYTSGIYIDDSAQTISVMKAKIKKLRYELERAGKTLDVVVIDYLQLVKTNEKILNREQQVGSIADDMKLMAKEFNIPVIALAQTNREAERNGRNYNVGDLRESARIEQDADVILFLNRPDEENKSKYILECAKNRHGFGFKQNLEFDAEILKFKEVE